MTLAYYPSKIIAIYNQKGGVAKTGTAVNLADLIASQGKRVLLIDWDPQGNAAPLLGMDMEPGVHDWLMNDNGAYIRQHVDRPNLYVLPGNQQTRRAARIIRDDIKENLLPANYVQEKLRNLVGRFDYTIIDMPPMSGDWCEEALRVQPEAVIIPASMDNMDLLGMKTAISTIRHIAPSSRMILLPTLFHAGWNVDEDNYQLLMRSYPRLVAEPIAYRALMREIRTAGQTLREYKPASSSEAKAKTEILTAFQGLIDRVTASQDGA